MKPNSKQIIKFTNCRILLNDKIVNDDLWIRNGRIEDKMYLFCNEKKSPDYTIDCHNAIISPGFIDTQINGGFGVDFSNPSLNVCSSLETVAKRLLETGVTCFCPTIISSPNEVYSRLLPQYAAYMKQHATAVDRAAVRGLHIEGPFISLTKRGMHSPDVLQSCENGIDDLLKTYSTLDSVSIVTIAPELKGALSAIGALTDRGLRVSLGHSCAGLETGEEGIAAGASGLTHLFCAMQPFHHRDPGLIGLLASKRTSRTVFFGIIADLKHTHAAALRLAYRIRLDGLMLVTDACPGLGCPDGYYRFGTEEVELREGTCYVRNTNTLSGAACPLDACVRNFFRVTDASREEALIAVTRRPAQFLGLEARKGVFTPGADADLVFLDDDLRVQSTWVAGQMAFAAEGVAYDLKNAK